MLYHVYLDGQHVHDVPADDTISALVIARHDLDMQDDYLLDTGSDWDQLDTGTIRVEEADITLWIEYVS